MANEWVLVARTEDPIDYVVANGTGIEKGTLLALQNSGTAIISTIPGQVCCGIAAREKIANDGRTQLAVYKKGIFRATASGTVTIGAPLISGAGTSTYLNTVHVSGNTTAVTIQSGCQIIGYAESAVATEDNTLQVRLDL